MNFMDKLKIITDLYYADKISGEVKCHMVIKDQPVSRKFIEVLSNRFPKLPNSYISFLEKFGSLKLDWFIFFGESNKNGVNLFDMLSIWKSSKIFEFEKNENCPFGYDGGGCTFYLNPQQQVLMVDQVISNTPPELIADSFDEFIGECILGKRYLEFMDEDDFYHFLQEQGWA